MKTPLLPAALAVLVSVPALSQVVVMPVPDGIGGLVQVRQITAPSLPLAELRVSLDLSGPDGFVGDLYATLQHESGAFAVLLNRPGRDASRPDGYADLGLRVTFDFYGPDMHTYRDTLGGPPAGGLLTGVWSTVGRTADPADVVTGSPRTASLSAFAGLEPGGEWILFLGRCESERAGVPEPLEPADRAHTRANHGGAAIIRLLCSLGLGAQLARGPFPGTEALTR